MLLADEGTKDVPRTVLTSSDFSRENGPWIVCFKKERQATAFIGVTAGNLFVDVCDGDKTVVVKMYIDKNMKEYGAESLLDTWGHWGKLFKWASSPTGRSVPRPELVVNVILEQALNLNCMITSLKHLRGVNGIKNITK